MEIGKYDMQQNTPVPLCLIKNGCSIHGVQVDELWLDANKELWSEVHDLVQGIAPFSISNLKIL